MLTKLETIFIQVILSLVVVVREDVFLSVIFLILIFVIVLLFVLVLLIVIVLLFVIVLLIDIVLSLVSLILLIEQLINIFLLANLRCRMIIPDPLMIGIFFDLGLLIVCLLLLRIF